MANPTIKCYIQLGNADLTAFTLDSTTQGVLDTDLLGADSAFEDVSTDVVSFSTNRKRSKQLGGETAAGTASIRLRNENGHYDPEYVDGDYYGQILPLRKINLFAKADEIEIPIYAGRIADWQVEYSSHIDESFVNIECVDEFERLAATEIVTEITTPGAEQTGERIERVLDSNDVRYPASRDIDTGQSEVDDRTVDVGENVRDYLNDVNLAENGSLFIGRDGVFTFRGRHAQFADSTAIATDDGGNRYLDLVADPNSSGYISVADSAGVEPGTGSFTYMFYGGLASGGSGNHFLARHYAGGLGWRFSIVSFGASLRFTCNGSTTFDMHDTAASNWFTDNRFLYPSVWGVTLDATAQTSTIWLDGAVLSTKATAALGDLTASDEFRQGMHYNGVGQNYVAGAFFKQAFDVGQIADLSNLFTQRNLAATNAIKDYSPTVYFDIRNSNCYAGSGNTVSDLTTNANDGTLTNPSNINYLQSDLADEDGVTPARGITTLPYSAATLSVASIGEVYNTAITQRVGPTGGSAGTKYTETDSDSEGKYGPRVLKYDELLLSSDTVAEDFGKYLVGRYGTASTRMEEITVPLSGLTTAQQEEALALELGDMLTIERTPTSYYTFDARSMIDEIKITGNPNRWDMQMSFSNADDIDWFVLDSTSRGILDTNQLAY